MYGDIDEAGFFEGEINGVRGLVPSNFLSEITDDYNQQMGSKHYQLRSNQPITRYQGANSSNNAVSGSGMGARGPPPPPRDNQNVRGLRKTGEFAVFVQCFSMFQNDYLHFCACWYSMLKMFYGQGVTLQGKL